MVSYQTIKLSTGKHSSPEVGACVMELASMLAGEPFSDHPESVCPVIGSFLRAYNDMAAWDRVEHKPPIDVLGIYAARSVSRPTDERHAAALALIDKLLALDTISKSRSRSARGEAGAPQRGHLTDFVHGAHLW